MIKNSQLPPQAPMQERRPRPRTHRERAEVVAERITAYRKRLTKLGVYDAGHGAARGDSGVGSMIRSFLITALAALRGLAAARVRRVTDPAEVARFLREVDR